MTEARPPDLVHLLLSRRVPGHREGYESAVTVNKSDTDDARAGARAMARIAELMDALDNFDRDLMTALVSARVAGVPDTQVAAVLGVSRQTVTRGVDWFLDDFGKFLSERQREQEERGEQQ